MAELQLNPTNFKEEIGNGTVLVDFWAPWCGPCMMQGPIIDSLAEKMQGKAKVAKCNVDEAQDVAAEYGVQSIPTLIIFKDGEEVERFVGLQSAEKLEASLSSHA